MMRSPITPLLSVLISLVAPSVGLAQIQGAPPLEVLYGFTLIDGRGGPPLEDAAIAIRGNEILTVASRRDLLSGPDAPRDAIVVNLGGGYVIPGLIDAHVHLATVPNRERAEAELYRQLYGGLIAVRDMAGDGRALASLARDAKLGQIDAPDIYYSALMAGPSFLTDPRPQSSAAGEVAGQVPWMQAITPETELVTAVARAKGTYATGIKIYANLAPAEVRNITAEAHRQGMQVWAHSMVFPTRPSDVVRSDVDVISHVCRIAWEGMANAPTEYHHDQVPQYANFSAASPVFTELFTEMRSRGTILDATLAMYARAEQNPRNPTSDRCDTGFARELVKRAFEEGISIAAGTDFTTPLEEPFPALYEELEELVTHGGLTPMAAIESATRVAAEAIGIQATHGTLVHGRPVSFVLLAENPLEDIANLRSIRAVWKNAQRFDRSAYRAPLTEADVAEEEPTSGAASVQQALEMWLGLWRRYDLDGVGEVFRRDPSLTYFASDSEGVKEGFDAVLGVHEALGFTSGGFRPENELWLENTLIADFDGSAVITAEWHFGNRVAVADAARGPMTMVVIRTTAGYRISHLNMGNYPPSG
ncbi:MAG: amidohydrolase family protein [Gemmatimonadetes bacterium]|nr:amidohydrolase family protein [Gemmatimonadota bacterium]